MSQLYAEWVAVAAQIALEAGAQIKARWREAHQVRSKGFRDIVTESDLAAEQIILRGLHTAFPTHAILSEEAGGTANSAAIQWYVDPLDGTTNYARHNPNFCTSIAAVETASGQPVVGVVYDPLRDHLFTAWQDGGAYFNSQSLHTSGATQIETAVFGMDFPRDPLLRQHSWAYAGQMLSHARTMRALGAAALNLTYVAAGWIDVYFALTLKPWDQAAAALLVREAGGAVGTLSGAPWTPMCAAPLMAATDVLLHHCHELLHEQVG